LLRLEPARLAVGPALPPDGRPPGRRQPLTFQEAGCPTRAYLPAGANPTPMRRSRAKLRIISPAPASSTTARAAWTITNRARRFRSGRPLPGSRIAMSERFLHVCLSRPQGRCETHEKAHCAGRHQRNGRHRHVQAGGGLTFRRVAD
jgi:hypothetical protein